MQTRKKQRVVIVALVTVIIGMAVGYSALGHLLNIHGTSRIVGGFHIEFTKIEESAMANATTVSKSGIGTTTE